MKVVFVEGGQSDLSLELVLSGEFDSSATDIKFWAGLFRHFRQNENFQFRAIGSKSTLNALIDKIKNENARNIFIAMDRDYDNHLGKINSIPGILHTYGYAWENDVWCKSVTEDLLSQIVTSALHRKHIKTLHHLRKTFLQGLARILRLHITLRHYDQSLLPRDSFAGIYDPTTLILQKSRLRQLLISAKAKRIQGIKYHAPKNWNVSMERDCPCHLIAFYSIHLIRKVFKDSQSSKLSISNEILTNLAVSTFLSAIESHLNKRAFAYYEKQFDRLPA